MAKQKSMTYSPYDEIRLPEGPPSPLPGYQQIRTLGELRQKCSIWRGLAAPCLAGTSAVYWGGDWQTFGLKQLEGLWVFRFCEGNIQTYHRIIAGLGGDYRLALY
jgi:hypothetical protein